MPFRKAKPWSVQPPAGTPLNADALKTALAYVVGGVELIQKLPLSPVASPTSLKSVGLPGVGVQVKNGSDKWDAVGRWSVSPTDFTMEILLSMTAAAQLGQVFGISEQLPSATLNTGNQRSTLCFGGGSNDHIYFWGAGADLDSGVSWRTDGSVQHVFITATGGTMTFYRDGKVIASGATPALIASPSPAYVTVGSYHSAGSTSPSLTLYKGSIRNRALSQAEISALTANPWLDFEPPRRRVISHVAAGGPQSFSYTAAGGIVFAGAAPQVRKRVNTAAGGITFAGTAPYSSSGTQTRTVTASGGITFAGAAAQILKRVNTALGGITFAGTSAQVLRRVNTAAGGITFVGAATQVLKRAVLASGGITFGGAASVTTHIAKLIVTAAGGIVFGGAAAVSYVGRVARDWIIKIRRRRL